MMEFLKENSPYFVMMFVGFLSLGRIMMDSPIGLLGKYRKMPDEEKALYDKKKVKRMQFVPTLLFVALSVLVFIFDVFLSGIIPTKLFMICLLVDLAALLMTETKFALNWLVSFGECNTADGGAN